MNVGACPGTDFYLHERRIDATIQRGLYVELSQEESIAKTYEWKNKKLGPYTSCHLIALAER